jgi:hypothetical protein
VSIGIFKYVKTKRDKLVNDMPETPRQTFRISEYVWQQFQKKCAAKGYSASEVLRAFIMEVVKGNISVESVHPEKSAPGQTLANDDMLIEWFKKRQTQ